MYKKKSLGQHFLKSAAYLRAVTDAADIKEGEVVVEVGPGDGALTQELLARGAHVVAIEKDHRLIPLLEQTFKNEIGGKKLRLVEADALLYDISKNLQRGETYKVVGNIPYYITGALLRTFLSGKRQPSTLVFLIQKEVAERIAKSKKESLLSLSVKAYGIPTYTKTVPRGAFAPPPGVDSGILLVKNISRHNFASAMHEKNFFALVRAGFAQKRKLLKRNIEKILGERASLLMQKARIPASARAEDVPLREWLLLSED